MSSRSNRAYISIRIVLRSCLMCGEPEWDAAGHAQRELTYAEATRERNVRCTRCDGSLVIAEVALRRFRRERPVDWSRRFIIPVLRTTP